MTTSSLLMSSFSSPFPAMPHQAKRARVASPAPSPAAPRCSPVLTNRGNPLRGITPPPCRPPPVRLGTEPAPKNFVWRPQVFMADSAPAAANAARRVFERPDDSSRGSLPLASSHVSFFFALLHPAFLSASFGVVVFASGHF